jgi:hypothetical protein
MSNELIPLHEWIEKHSFDQRDTFSFFVGKTLDGVTIRSSKTKVSEAALDSYISDVRTAQKRKPANKGVKKVKTETDEPKTPSKIKITKIDKPKPASQKPKAETTPAAAPKSAEPAPQPKPVPPPVQPKPVAAQEPEPKPEPEPIQEKPAKEEPKKQPVAFTADVSKVVDPAVLARIQKSQQEKASMRGSGGGHKRDIIKAEKISNLAKAAETSKRLQPDIAEICVPSQGKPKTRRKQAFQLAVPALAQPFKRICL